MQPLKFWCHLAAIFTLAGRSEQIDENVTFAEQPYPGNIYAYVGVALTIPCRATSGGPSPRNISTNLVLNSAPFNVYFPPDRYGAETDNNGAIIGFVINGVMEQDSGATFSCTVGTLSSTVGTLLVKDGTPGAVQGLAQVNQPSLYCVTVGWSGAPFPPNGPILLYTVTLTTEMGVVKATYNVSAEDVMQCTLCGLLPDTSYSVAMVALNNYGYGDPSSNVTVRTATPIVLAPPSDIQAVPLTSQDSTTTINISWQPPQMNSDLMTPLVAYLVVYGLDTSHTSNITATPNVTSALISGIRKGVAYVVGVAAMNSAGLSNVTYLSHPLNISTESSMNEYIIIGITCGLCVLILVAVVLIVCVWCKKRRISAIHIRRLEGGSPNSVKKFRAAVPLNDIGVSPVLGRHHPAGYHPPMGTPNSSETSSVATDSPSLSNTSKGSVV